jgi:hypothetical protein
MICIHITNNNGMAARVLAEAGDPLASLLNQGINEEERLISWNEMGVCTLFKTI